MRLIAPGRVHLDEGEVMPCSCDWCGWMYKPPAGTQASVCPICHTINVHDEQQWEHVHGDLDDHEEG